MSVETWRRPRIGLWIVATGLIVIGGLWATACRNDPGGLQGDLGVLRVSVLTSGAGVDLDPDGYSVRVDGGEVLPISVNGVTARDVIAGQHSVELTETAANCPVEGANPRAVTVPRGDTVDVSFSVACGPQSLAGLVVSNPVSTSRVGGSAAQSGTLTAAQGDSMVYASLAPGSVPDGVTAEIQNRRAGLTVGTFLTNGGFDPIGVSAGVGDTIEVVVRNAGGAALLDVRVAAAAIRRPIVVRTDPPPKKRDVPLNTRMLVVFSEPVDAATVTTQSIQLFSGSTPVSGTVEFLDGSHLVAAFTPAAELSPSTDYQLVVTEAIRDLQGDALEQSVAAEFTTGTSVTGGVASVTLNWEYLDATSIGSGIGSTAEVRDANGNVLYDRVVHWSSSNPGVATVSSETGRTITVWLVAPGVSTITATSEGRSDSAMVVVQPVADGAVRVTVATAGTDLDPDGYTFWMHVGGYGVEEQLALNDTVIVFPVSGGLRPFSFGGSASNCLVTLTPAPAYPGQVLVTPGDTANLDFAVHCLAPGTLRITATTIGDSLSSSARYGVSVHGWASGASSTRDTLSPNGALVLTRLAPVEYQVELDVPDHCAVSGGNRRLVTVVTGDTAELAYQVTCVNVAFVRVTPVDTTIAPGQLVEFKATPLDSAGNPVEYQVKYPSWSTSNVSVATMSGGFAIGTLAGTTTITANFGRVQGSTQLTVGGAPLNIDGEWRFAYPYVTPPCSDAVLILSQNGLAFTGTLTRVGNCPPVAPSPVTDGVLSGVYLSFTVDSCEYGAALMSSTGAPPLPGSTPDRMSGASCGDPEPTRWQAARPGAAARLVVDPASLGMISGGAAPLQAIITTLSAGPRVVTAAWSSDNPAVATVSGSGVVTALAPGEATITASAEGMSGAARISVVAGVSFGSVSAGGARTCGTTDGEAYCWGIDVIGFDGTISGVPHTTPVAVPGGLNLASLSLGGGHSCGLTSAGTAYCWGSNTDGQLGNASLVRSAVPVAVLGGLTFASVSAGSQHTCALTTAGVAYCWGFAPTAVAGGLTFLSLSTTGHHTCGVTTDSAAYCWGRNVEGQLGSGSADYQDHPTPLPVTGGLTFTSVSAGYDFTCGLTPTGAAYCWGANAFGQLGIGSSDGLIHPTPELVVGGFRFTSLTTGSQHVCGLTDAGNAHCWGSNFRGELGDGTTANRTAPTPVAGGLTFASLTAQGYFHTCGRSTGAVVYCWGDNQYGQLGNGSIGASTIPVKVRGQP